MREDEFLSELLGCLDEAPEGQVWAGDDAAIVEGQVAVATDSLVEGVHFRLDWADPESVGYKALAVNLSDLAATGCLPTSCVVSVVVPPGGGETALAVLRGLRDAGRIWSCPLVGGDTCTGSCFVVSVAVTGRPAASAPLLRSGARPGDRLWLTGEVGGASAVLRRLRSGETPDPEETNRLNRPTPRLREGAVSAECGATAAIDVSDGLALDLARLCRASEVGARIDSSRVPKAAAADWDDAFHGGEDYELLLAAPPSVDLRHAFSTAGLDPPHLIGELTAEPDIVLVEKGSVRALDTRGYLHEL
ncbi:MAG: thiamine-monophosphate kinase [Acidimicrobiales bacterium]|nr:MAG: thiamine-monophosphate kinase [Acidimicrobiales bacterium]